MKAKLKQILTRNESKKGALLLFRPKNEDSDLRIACF